MIKFVYRETAFFMDSRYDIYYRLQSFKTYLVLTFNISFQIKNLVARKFPFPRVNNISPARTRLLTS